MTDQQLQPGLVPGDELNLSVDDLLLLNGRVNAQLELERSKNQALRQAYNQLRVDFDSYKSSQETDAKPSAPKKVK